MSTSEVKERKKLQSFTVTPKLKIGNFTQKKSEIENSQSLSKAQKAIQIQKIQEERRESRIRTIPLDLTLKIRREELLAKRNASLSRKSSLSSAKQNSQKDSKEKLPPSQDFDYLSPHCKKRGSLRKKSLFGESDPALNKLYDLIKDNKLSKFAEGCNPLSPDELGIIQPSLPNSKLSKSQRSSQFSRKEHQQIKKTVKKVTEMSESSDTSESELSDEVLLNAHSKPNFQKKMKRGERSPSPNQNSPGGDKGSLKKPEKFTEIMKIFKGRNAQENINKYKNELNLLRDKFLPFKRNQHTFGLKRKLDKIEKEMIGQDQTAIAFKQANCLFRESIERLNLKSKNESILKFSIADFNEFVNVHNSKNKLSLLPDRLNLSRENKKRINSRFLRDSSHKSKYNFSEEEFKLMTSEVKKNACKLPHKHTSSMPTSPYPISSPTILHKFSSLVPHKQAQTQAQTQSIHHSPNTLIQNTNNTRRNYQNKRKLNSSSLSPPPPNQLNRNSRLDHSNYINVEVKGVKLVQDSYQKKRKAKDLSPNSVFVSSPPYSTSRVNNNANSFSRRTHVSSSAKSRRVNSSFVSARASVNPISSPQYDHQFPRYKSNRQIQQHSRLGSANSSLMLHKNVRNVMQKLPFQKQPNSKYTIKHALTVDPFHEIQNSCAELIKENKKVKRIYLKKLKEYNQQINSFELSGKYTMDEVRNPFQFVQQHKKKPDKKAPISRQTK